MAQRDEVRRGDDANDVGCVERDQRRLVERGWQVDHDGVSLSASDIDRLPDESDADERTFWSAAKA